MAMVMLSAGASWAGPARHEGRRSRWTSSRRGPWWMRTTGGMLGALAAVHSARRVDAGRSPGGDKAVLSWARASSTSTRLRDGTRRQLCGPPAQIRFWASSGHRAWVALASAGQLFALPSTVCAARGRAARRSRGWRWPLVPQQHGVVPP